MKFLMEALTQLHVGSGENMLHNMDYIQRNDMPFIVDQQLLFEWMAVQSHAQASNSRTLTEIAKQMNNKDLPGYAISGMGGIHACPHEIRQQIKDAFWHPIIPGTSLKGAIRTALLADHLRTQGIRQSDIPYRSKDGKASTSNKTAGLKASKSFFGQDPNHDWMRAWKPGDTAFALQDVQLADVRFLNITPELKWKRMAGGKANLPQWSDAKGVYAEVIAPGSVTESMIVLDEFLFQNSRAKQQLHWNDVPGSFENLREIVNRHAVYRLEWEIAFYNHHGWQPASKICDDLLYHIQQQPEAMYLQMGWGSGWRGMTGDWQYDAGIEEDMRKLYDLGKHGADVFPKTRRLAVYDGEPSMPFGWLRLWPHQAAPASIVQCIQDDEHQAWLTHRQSILSDIRQEEIRRIAQMEKQRQEKEEQARRKAEQEAAERARLASMTPLDRELEPLLARGEGAIGDLLKGLESGQWQGEDVRIVAEKLKVLLEENGSWLPSFEGKNKLKKKKHERTLKVLKFLK